MLKPSRDLSEFLFRFLFCLIFVGLGGEHILDDTLIQKLMPDWVPYKRLVSFGCGVWLAGWGMLILVGWKVNWAAVALGAFLILVTAAVHVPGLFFFPTGLSQVLDSLFQGARDEEPRVTAARLFRGHQLELLMQCGDPPAAQMLTGQTLGTPPVGLSYYAAKTSTLQAIYNRAAANLRGAVHSFG